MDFSGCIKISALNSLESLKNIAEISKNPFSSFFQIIQEQQDQKNSSMYPVLAEINSYAHVNEYGDCEDIVIRRRKMTFNNELMEPFALNEDFAIDLKRSSIESDQNNYGLIIGRQPQQMNLNFQQEGDRFSQSNECQRSEYCNGYEEEDQENEDGCANTPGFTSNHPSPASKRINSDIIIKPKTCTEQNRVSNEYFTRSQMLFEGSPVFSTRSISPQYPPYIQKYPQRVNKKFRLDDDIEEEEDEGVQYLDACIDLQESTNNANYEDHHFTAPAPILSKQFMSTQFNLSLPAFGQVTSPRKNERNLLNNSPIRKDIANHTSSNNQQSNQAQKQPLKIFDSLISNPKGYTQRNSNDQLKEIIKNSKAQHKKETVMQLNSQDIEFLQISQDQKQSQPLNEPKIDNQKIKKKIEFKIPSSQNVNGGGKDLNGIDNDESDIKHGIKQRNQFHLRKGSFCCVENEDEADIEEEANSQINSCFQLIDSPFSKCQHESKPSYNNLDSEPQYALISSQYKSIGKHLERLQKLVDKIKLTQVPRKYIFISQHTVISFSIFETINHYNFQNQQCLERVKLCLEKSKKMNAQPFIVSCLYIIQFQLLQNKFNIIHHDKQKQKQIAFKSQVAYQKAFASLEPNYKQTLEFIQSFHSSSDNIKQSMVQLYIDSKLMALPQNYHQLIEFIHNLNNLTHSFYLLILSQQGQSQNRDVQKLKLQRHVSTPNSAVKSQSQFVQQSQSQKIIKKSNSNTQLNQYMMYSNIFKETSTAAESEFKQDLSTRYLNSLSNLGQLDQLEQEYIKINGQENGFNFQNNSMSRDNNQDKSIFSVNDHNNRLTSSNNETQNIFNFNITQNNEIIDNQFTNNGSMQNQNILNVNTNPFFGLSQEQSSRSSSIRSSHFNEDNDIYNSPISTPNNVFAAGNIQNNPSQITNQSSFQNKFDFQKIQSIDNDSTAIKKRGSNDLQISHFQSNESQEYSNKLDIQTKYPFGISDNEDTALPTFRSQQLNQVFDFSHTPSTQYGNIEQQN